MYWRWVVGTVLVAGFVLTAGNLVAAFLSVRKQVSMEAKRIADSEALAEQEKQEQAARPKDQVTQESSAAIHEKYRLLYEERGLIRPNMGNLAFLPAHEAKRIVGLILDTTRDNLIWAGVGLLLSTVAGVWSLWL